MRGQHFLTEKSEKHNKYIQGAVHKLLTFISYEKQASDTSMTKIMPINYSTLQNNPMEHCEDNEI